VLYDHGDVAAALEAFDAAIAIDPSFAQAWSTKGGCLAYLGRFDDARAAIDRAARTSPTATEALTYRAQIDEQSGRCADEEADVRKWLSRDPDDWYAYHYLARALAAEGKPLDTVRTALEQKWVRLDPAQRDKRAGIDRALVDMLSADFLSAEKYVEGVEKLLASEPGAQAHAESLTMLLHIAEETGRPERARAVAEKYLARKDAWAPPHRVDDVSIRMDPVPEMLSVLEQGGALTRAQHEDQRAAWARSWRAKTGPAYVGLLWVVGWAAVARTPQDAAEALRVQPEFGPLPPFTPWYPGGADVGHAYLLAGREEAAIEPLRHGAATCTQLTDPVGYVRAWLDLGTTLDRQGDRDGACSAYRVVLDRWGRAKPRSVTAEQARARATTLSCR
jgi:serine/threonine-protein kinase